MTREEIEHECGSPLLSGDDANRELFLCMTELEDIIAKGLRYPEDMTLRVDDYRLRDLHNRMRRACQPWLVEKQVELAERMAAL